MADPSPPPIATPADPGPAPAPFEHEAQLQRVLARLRTPPRPTSGALLLVLSLVAFLLVRSSDTVVELGALVAVLLLHEGGHWAGMKLLGWRDVRLFFIPFFGAATSGRPAAPSGWKEGVVLLLGPVPGIVLGAALAFSLSGPPHPALRSAIVMLLTVNAFNLLPVGLLDGGRLLQLTIFQRHRHLEVAFLCVAAGLFLLAAVGLRDGVLGAVGVVTLLGVPGRHRLLRAAHALRAQGVVLPADPGALAGDAARATFQAACAIVPAPRREDARMAATMESLARLGGRRTPTAAQTLGFLAAGGLALVLAVAGGVALGRPGVAGWRPVDDPEGAYRVLMPGTPTVEERPPAAPWRHVRNRRSVLGDHAFVLTDFTVEPEVALDVGGWGERYAHLLAGPLDPPLDVAAAVRFERRPIQGHPGFTAELTRPGGVTWIHGLHRGDHLYVLTAHAPAGSPLPARFLGSFELR